MASVNSEHNFAFAEIRTLHDLQVCLGDIPASRIRLHPTPGHATIQDVLDIDVQENRPCELVDGVIVEKTVGYFESMLAILVAAALREYLNKNNLGIVLGADGTLRILPDQVRAPDVCFISWQKFPDRKLPSEPIPSVAPNLAIEIISKGNTEAEMDRKLKDYFTSGVELVWYIDAATATARVYQESLTPQYVDQNGSLDGGSLLPGFQLALRELFLKATNG
jgi:Uma2 family endonuclease